jgi:hypothetical protein
MVCECGGQYQRTFPATVEHTVYFDPRREAHPVQWTAGDLSVCVNCGQVTSCVPADALQLLRDGAGETAA